MWRTVLILVLTLVWAAASNHCRLELVPGLDFLACCDHPDSAPHQDEDCNTDGCATVENQLYKTEDAEVAVVGPSILKAFLLPPLADELSVPATPLHFQPDAAPMVLPRVWQFSYRTALPPRAPSILS